MFARHGTLLIHYINLICNLMQSHNTNTSWFKKKNENTLCRLLLSDNTKYVKRCVFLFFTSSLMYDIVTVFFCEGYNFFFKKKM